MSFSSYAVVEELFKRREPMPSMDVVYFMQPAREKYCHSSLFLFILDCGSLEGNKVIFLGNGKKNIRDICHIQLVMNNAC